MRPEDWWLCSPGDSFFRLSRIVVLFSLFFLLEEKIKSRPRLCRFFQGLGQESLFLYVGHVMVIYGTAVNVGLVDFAPNGFPPLAVFCIFILLTLVGYQLAMIWQSYKLAAPRQSRMTLATLFLFFLLLFILNP